MFRSDSIADAHVADRTPPHDGDFVPLQVEVAPRRIGRVQRGVKRLIDIAGALFFFIVFGPLYLAVAVSVRLSMGGPVHFWHYRFGENGKRFRFYKFRSMVHDSESVLEDFLVRNHVARTEWDTFQKLVDDPRITPLGRFIRKLSLDELPQFWNVLKGDMSLVGPRPCMERQRSLYGRQWTHYCMVRPGITGLWQVSGRNRLPYSKRVELDAHYVDNWSLWLDFKILLRTIKTVVTAEGSR